MNNFFSSNFNNAIEIITKNVQIEKEISEYINLMSKGNYFLAICPFHNDHKPSMNISVSKQIFKCFSCGVGGSVIYFIQKFKKLSFLDALLYFSKKYNLNLNIKINTKKLLIPKLWKEISIINKKILDFWNYQLLINYKKINSNIFEFCKKRMIDIETIKNFNLGYSSNNNNEFIEFLNKEKYDLNFLIKIGILNVNKNNKYLNCFRNRIIFPIYDKNNLLLGFSGRIIETLKSPSQNNISIKYLNSKNNTWFKKNTLLFNLNSLNNINYIPYIFITEGYFDTIALNKLNIKQSVAIMGVDFSKTHLAILKKFTNKFYIAFDNDSAGIISTYKLITLLLKNNFEPYVLFIPEQYKDIAEWLEKEKNLTKEIILNSTKHFFKFFKFLYKKRSISIENKFITVQKIINSLGSVSDSLKSLYYLNEWSKITGINIKEINNYIKFRKTNFQNNFNSKLKIQNTQKVNKIEVQIFNWFANYWNEYRNIEYWFQFDNNEINNNFQKILKILHKNIKISNINISLFEYLARLEFDPNIISFFEKLLINNNFFLNNLFILRIEYFKNKFKQCINNLHNQLPKITEIINKDQKIQNNGIEAIVYGEIRKLEKSFQKIYKKQILQK